MNLFSTSSEISPVVAVISQAFLQEASLFLLIQVGPIALEALPVAIFHVIHNRMES